MREILFRGRRIDNGEWAEGCYYESKISGVYILVPELKIRKKDGVAIGDNFAVYQVDPDTVGQYTGLKDKNGKRIFEGDIIQFSYTGENKGVEGRAAVIFENGAFGVAWGWHKEFVHINGFANTTFEIISNVHDNPEMIGGD